MDQDDGGPRKKAPKTIAVIDPDSCFGAFALLDLSGRLSRSPAASSKNPTAMDEWSAPCAPTCASAAASASPLGNPTAPQQREFGCPADYDAINMMPWEECIENSDK